MKTRGGIEEWIRRLEQYMILTIQRGIKIAYADSFKYSLTEWMLMHPCQVNIYCTNFICLRLFLQLA